jgi:hypothetical protein
MPNSTADADTLRAQTTADWETVDENWVPAVPKIILETEFYGRHWNLQWIETTADSKTIDKNSVPADQKIIQEPSSTADTHIYSAYRLTLTEKTLT